jgi:hypothetical protein
MTGIENAIARNIAYGVDETNPLGDSDAYYQREWEHMTLAALRDAGGKVTRVRWLTERQYADLSYVHGTLPNGTPVRLTHTPTGGLARDRMGILIEWAKEEGVFAKGIGLLDRGNWSTLRG